MTKRREALRRTLYGLTEGEKRAAITDGVLKAAKSPKSTVAAVDLPTGGMSVLARAEADGVADIALSDLITMPDNDERRRLSTRNRFIEDYLRPNDMLRHIPYVPLGTRTGRFSASTANATEQERLLDAFGEAIRNRDDEDTIVLDSIPAELRRPTNMAEEQERNIQTAMSLPRGDPRRFGLLYGSGTATLRNYQEQAREAERIAATIDYSSIERRILTHGPHRTTAVITDTEGNYIEQMQRMGRSMRHPTFAPVVMGLDRASGPDGQFVRFLDHGDEVSNYEAMHQSSFEAAPTRIMQSEVRIDYESLASEISEEDREAVRTRIAEATRQMGDAMGLTADALGAATQQMEQATIATADLADSLRGLTQLDADVPNPYEDTDDWMGGADFGFDEATPEETAMEKLVLDVNNMSGDEATAVALALLTHLEQSRSPLAFKPAAQLEQSVSNRSLNVHVSFRVGLDQITNMVLQTGGTYNANDLGFGNLAYLIHRKAADEANDKVLLERLANIVNNDANMNAAMKEAAPDLMKVINKRLADKHIPVTPSTRANVEATIRDAPKKVQSARRSFTVRKSSKSKKPDLD